MNNEDISIRKEIHVLAVRVRLLYEFRTKTNFARSSPAVQNLSSHAGRPGTRLIQYNNCTNLKYDVNVFISYRRSFMQLSSSPEAFLMLRSHFARTYGCMSICQYVLGIGDRHLSNMMVDLECGGVVGIDFGHAFGSATQVN
jgi:phosphatidylinositol kinase/protein kinase (PI-3  family)